MNPASKSSLPTALDPVAAALVAQLQETIAEQNRQIARNQQTIASYQMHVQKLEEELRLERIRKYGKQSEKLSDLQLELWIASPPCRATRSRRKLPAVRCPQPRRRRRGDAQAQKQAAPRTE
jgi:hypothetical protein